MSCTSREQETYVQVDLKDITYAEEAEHMANDMKSHTYHLGPKVLTRVLELV